MIVDDEFPALKMAESVLRTFEEVNICGIFSDGEELLERLNQDEAELVLVDMKMPGMHGLELAGRIQELRPDSFIVFVTAYDDYAVDAFETEALDYIMKPITAERMQKTLERYHKRRAGEKKDAPVKIIVKSFGRFSVEKTNGETMKFRTAKTEEMLAFLLHYGGNPVPKEKIMDELWYDRDAERAQSMLYTTLYQLRKDLESFGLTNLIQHSRKDGGLCRISWQPDEWDYAEFSEGCRQQKAGGISIDFAKNIVELHKNGYLADHGYSWAEDKRIEMELCYIELLEEIINQEVHRVRFESALQYLRRWADLSPYTERVHDKIIAIYLLMNKKDVAISYCRKIEEMFAEEMGVQLQVDLDAIASNPSVLFQNTPKHRA